MPLSPEQEKAVSELSARAEALEQRTSGPATPPTHSRAVDQAYRIVVELFAGVLAGLGLGWGFDRLAGTNPWGLIAGVLLGFAVSIYLARRTANRLMAQAAAEQAAAEAEQASARKGADRT